MLERESIDRTFDAFACVCSGIYKMQVNSNCTEIQRNLTSQPIEFVPGRFLRVLHYERMHFLCTQYCLKEAGATRKMRSLDAPPQVLPYKVRFKSLAFAEVQIVASEVPASGQGPGMFGSAESLRCIDVHRMFCAYSLRIP